MAILGDMLEVGDSTPAAHRAIAGVALATVACCVLVGEAFSQAGEESGVGLRAPAAIHPELTDAAAETVAALLRPGHLAAISHLGVEKRPSPLT